MEAVLLQTPVAIYQTVRCCISGHSTVIL